MTAVFENTAGQGSNLGWNFEQLRTMIDRTGVPERCGVCLDTCHAFASGMDLSTEAGYEKFWADFERVIGLEFLKGMHLNDARGVCGGRLDRHESLGRGSIGIGCFERLLRDPRTDGIPLILETPDETLWSEEIARLKAFAGC